MEAFDFLMNDPKLRTIPKYLETPEGPSVWKEEISTLRNLVK
jgi:deoxyribonuclease-4